MNTVGPPFDSLTRVTIPDGLPRWLLAFVEDALSQNDLLVENGAHEAAIARAALLNRLMLAANSYSESELDISQAAALIGRHPETVRRAIRDGAIPDRRLSPRGHHKVRRGDLDVLGGRKSSPRTPYDPAADAREILKMRRSRNPGID